MRNLTPDAIATEAIQMFWERFVDLGGPSADDDDLGELLDRAEAQAVSEVTEGVSVVLPEEQQRVAAADCLYRACKEANQLASKSQWGYAHVDERVNKDLRAIKDSTAAAIAKAEAIDRFPAIDNTDALIAALRNLYAYHKAPECFTFEHRRVLLNQALAVLERCNMPATVMDAGPEKEIPL